MKFFENEAKNAKFIKDNLMGPNALTTLAELLENLQLNKNMRILDLGCGKGLTSMLLAKATGAQIFAADLWISPTETYEHFKELGFQGQIIPLSVDATKPLPFADNYFDAVISIDAFQYFGTPQGYLDTHIIPLVKKGGIIAIGIPGQKNDIDEETLKIMTPHLRGETNFHSLNWWKQLWQKSNNIEIMDAFSMKSHQAAWQDWLKSDFPGIKDDIEMMKADGDKYFDTIALVAKVIKP